MANINYKSELTERNAVLITWQLKAGDTAQPYSFGRASVITAEARGDFAGAKVQIAGSNGAKFHPLQDPHGKPVIFSDAGLARVDQFPIDMRPEILGATNKTDVTITLAIRRL